MPPISWTSKWRMPIVRRPASRVIAKHSGSRSSSDSPASRALAQLGELRLELVVVEQLQLGLEAVDGLDALGVLLELTGFAHPQGLVEELRHGPSD